MCSQPKVHEIVHRPMPLKSPISQVALLSIFEVSMLRRGSVSSPCAASAFQQVTPTVCLY
jgi:hypothetical protein